MTTSEPAEQPALWRQMAAPTVGRIAVALVLALIVAGIAAANEKRKPAEFQSAATMVIDQPNAIVAAGGEGVILKLNQLRIKYGTLMRTQALLLPVAKRLNVPPGVVNRALGVALPGQSLVMIVTARTGSQKLAMDIANAMAEEIGTFTKSEQDAAPVKIPENQRIIWKIVARAQPGFKVAPTRQRILGTGAIAGAIAFVLAYVLIVVYRFVRRRS